jgi:hypothetical protein
MQKPTDAQPAANGVAPEVDQPEGPQAEPVAPSIPGSEPETNQPADISPDSGDAADSELAGEQPNGDDFAASILGDASSSAENESPSEPVSGVAPAPEQSDILAALSKRLGHDFSNVDDVVSFTEDQRKSAALIDPDIDAAIKSGTLSLSEVDSGLINNSAQSLMGSTEGIESLARQQMSDLGMSNEDIEEELGSMSPYTLRSTAKQYADKIDAYKQGLIDKAKAMADHRQAAKQSAAQQAQQAADKFRNGVVQEIAKFETLGDYKLSQEDKDLLQNVLTTPDGPQRLLFGANPDPKVAVERAAAIIAYQKAIKVAGSQAANAERRRIAQEAQNVQIGMGQGQALSGTGALNPARQSIRELTGMTN